MNRKIAYALLKEIPYTKLISIIRSAKTDAPADMTDVVDLVVAACGEDENHLYQDLAKLTVAVPSIVSAIAEQTPLNSIAMMPGYQAAKSLSERVGQHALSFALNQKSLKGTKAMKFLESLEEELKDSK